MQILGIPRSIEQNGSALTRFLMPTKRKCLQHTTIANCNPFAIFMAGKKQQILSIYTYFVGRKYCNFHVFMSHENAMGNGEYKKKTL